ncbi:hypothetical protein GAG94_03375 [Lysinibacillus sphaericus]|uniref:hypothetical protein n=1 Tax=Lysinibacillus sphaericus TaxID=1421 RepID=UPI0013B0A23B|nr:hypothetical protein [Lysinibacillus sphaericus]MBG9689455.1 hypothetical protein [Lysinibacillus sphaericus]QIC46251.1 hypothetical protein GAG94_03375 [Lysinibacillus sphaericus]
MEKLLYKFRFVVYGIVVGNILTKGMQLFVSKDNHILFLALYAALAISTVPIVIKLDKKFIESN